MDLELLDQRWLVILLLIIWELVWKGMALWKAARAGDKAWYVIILVVNSVGILPIVYLLRHKDKAAQADS